MAANSNIEWTHHTANTWWGCTKVSDGCKHCYAETFSKRTGNHVWGPNASRRMIKSVWSELEKWAKAAASAGARHRVFWGSMMDVGEDRPELAEPRKRMCGVIERLEDLDFLLLSKRPENYTRLMPWGTCRWPGNVWAGTSTEDQPMADKRIIELLKVNAAVLWLSMEPLLGPVDLTKCHTSNGGRLHSLGGTICFGKHDASSGRGIDWVVVGGESGAHARPMHPDWARSIRDQCKAAGVAFFFKQWGEYGPIHEVMLQINRNFHKDDPYRFGKKAAGRLLDGRTWDEMPQIRSPKCLTHPHRQSRHRAR